MCHSVVTSVTPASYLVDIVAQAIFPVSDWYSQDGRRTHQKTNTQPPYMASANAALFSPLLAPGSLRVNCNEESARFCKHPGCTDDYEKSPSSKRDQEV